MKKWFFLLISHALFLLLGFIAGVYYLPIIIAPDAPSSEQVLAVADQASYTGYFNRELADSDALHWGEGNVFVGPQQIAFHGLLSPGPDYKLYLSPQYLETEADFHQLKSSMYRVGNVDTFENFILNIPADVDLNQYNSLIIWCEAFEQFITAAQFRES